LPGATAQLRWANRAAPVNNGLQLLCGRGVSAMARPGMLGCQAEESVCTYVPDNKDIGGNAVTDSGPYRHLFSPLRIRNTTLPNRVVFGPVCPTWVRSPHEGIFTEQAVAYYEERAKTGLGMIILGGHLINKDTIYTPLGFPGLWNDAQMEGLANVARAVKRHGCALALQLLHLGLRSPTPFLKTDPARDPDEYDPYMLAPSQVPAGEIPGGPTPKELEEHEIEYILQCFEDAARRAITAGLDGVEFHIAHGYLPWQFLSPFYNKRTDRWGGSYENRLRFSLEAMRRIRKRIGDRPFIGYRINSTSFWEGDLEIEDIKRIHADFERELDIDYVSVSAGVHHSWIHTPMTFEQGWEREYTRAIKMVAKKPVLLVGRVSHPAIADELLSSGDADAILLARQMIADEQWMTKVKEGRPHDIRRCVAANYCWRAVIRGSRVQCAYNPVVGRERVWGASSMRKVSAPKRVVVIGAGPAGLEYARIAAARGNHVVVYEREPEVGGHVRAYGALPNRTQYGTIATWLADQARGNGAMIKTSSEVTADGIDAVLADVRPDHVVVATGARYRRDGFQGQSAQPLPGWESGRCVTWDEIALDKVTASGNVLVIDEMADVAAPLTAVKLARLGARVKLLTKWPMIGWETTAEVYLHWVLTYLYEADVEIITDHAVKRISGAAVDVANLYAPAKTRRLAADTIVMATARASENALYRLLRARGHSVEAIGCAVAPRTVYEATLEGHRAARKLGAPPLSRMAMEALKNQALA
jgi:2,4-dienoyl-CoA reductase-like NADH-dependent reductase (Old Yellow Enzyme family)/thioredoxin reductase